MRMGDWGPATQHAWLAMAGALGLRHHHCTEGNQTLMRRPWLRSPDMLKKEKAWDRAHAPHAGKIPILDGGSLQVRALRSMYAILGAQESWGENAGPVVNQIIRANGGQIGEAWCGDTIAWCYRHAGSKAVQRAWASAWMIGVANGTGAVKDPVPGDPVVFIWQHVGMFEKWTDRAAGTFDTIEGNAGAGLGGVDRHSRNTSETKRFVRVYR